jgi:hypothetical protein
MTNLIYRVAERRADRYPKLSCPSRNDESNRGETLFTYVVFIGRVMDSLVLLSIQCHPHFVEVRPRRSTGHEGRHPRWRHRGMLVGAENRMVDEVMRP